MLLRGAAGALGWGGRRTHLAVAAHSSLSWHFDRGCHRFVSDRSAQARSRGVAKSIHDSAQRVRASINLLDGAVAEGRHDVAVLASRTLGLRVLLTKVALRFHKVTNSIDRLVALV